MAGARGKSVDKPKDGDEKVAQEAEKAPKEVSDAPVAEAPEQREEKPAGPMTHAEACEKAGLPERYDDSCRKKGITARQYRERLTAARRVDKPLPPLARKHVIPPKDGGLTSKQRYEKKMAEARAAGKAKAAAAREAQAG